MVLLLLLVIVQGHNQPSNFRLTAAKVRSNGHPNSNYKLPQTSKIRTTKYTEVPNFGKNHIRTTTPHIRKAINQTISIRTLNTKNSIPTTNRLIHYASQNFTYSNFLNNAKSTVPSRTSSTRSFTTSTTIRQETPNSSVEASNTSFADSTSAITTSPTNTFFKDEDKLNTIKSSVLLTSRVYSPLTTNKYARFTFNLDDMIAELANDSDKEVAGYFTTTSTAATTMSTVNFAALQNWQYLLPLILNPKGPLYLPANTPINIPSLAKPTPISQLVKHDLNQDIQVISTESFMDKRIKNLKQPKPIVLTFGQNTSKNHIFRDAYQVETENMHPLQIRTREIIMNPRKSKVKKVVHELPTMLRARRNKKYNAKYVRGDLYNKNLKVARNTDGFRNVNDKILISDPQNLQRKIRKPTPKFKNYLNPARVIRTQSFMPIKNKKIMKRNTALFKIDPMTTLRPTVITTKTGIGSKSVTPGLHVDVHRKESYTSTSVTTRKPNLYVHSNKKYYTTLITTPKRSSNGFPATIKGTTKPYTPTLFTKTSVKISPRNTQPCLTFSQKFLSLPQYTNHPTYPLITDRTTTNKIIHRHM